MDIEVMPLRMLNANDGSPFSYGVRRMVVWSKRTHLFRFHKRSGLCNFRVQDDLTVSINLSDLYVVNCKVFGCMYLLFLNDYLWNTTQRLIKKDVLQLYRALRCGVQRAERNAKDSKVNAVVEPSQETRTWCYYTTTLTVVPRVSASDMLLDRLSTVAEETSPRRSESTQGLYALVSYSYEEKSYCMQGE